MKQKEIWLANLNPTKGREQKGIRPLVIISGNTLNDNTDLLIGCPLTSIIKSIKGCIILKKNMLNNLKVDSEILTFQVKCFSKERLIKKIGSISDSELNQIRHGLLELLYY